MPRSCWNSAFPPPGAPFLSLPGEVWGSRLRARTVCWWDPVAVQRVSSTATQDPLSPAQFVLFGRYPQHDHHPNPPQGHRQLQQGR